LTAYSPRKRRDGSESSMGSANPLGNLSGSIEGFVDNASYGNEDEEGEEEQ